MNTFGDYDLLEEIGRGGSGVVYRARHRPLGRVVALKILHRLADADLSRRFHTELQAVGRLGHTNVVTVYSSGELDGRLYYDMQLIEGADLKSRPVAFRIQPRQTAGLMRKVALAVHHAHQEGVLHRDLKPANVLLDRAGEPHLIDFGTARLLENDPTLTTGVIGTTAYLSPEQALGRKQLTPASDVWALGVILYELITGRQPFQGDTTFQVLQAILNGRPTPPRWQNRQVSACLERVCLRCLEREPSLRYPSALELAEDLRRVYHGVPLTNEEAPADATGRESRLRRHGVRLLRASLSWARRRPFLLLAGCLVGAAWAASFLAPLPPRVHAVQQPSELYAHPTGGVGRIYPEGEIEAGWRQSVAAARTHAGPESEWYASSLANLANSLLLQEKTDEAEEALRECLPILEKCMPNSRGRYWAMSVLGGLFLDQNKVSEAEPLIVGGYQGLKATHNLRGWGHDNLRIGALLRLIRLYSVQGKDQEAERHRWELRALAVSSP